MTPTYKIPGFDFMFKRVLRLDKVEGFFKKSPELNDPNDNHPKVFYTDYIEELGKTKHGVAIVIQEGEKLLYCKAFTNKHFAKSWLYTSRGYLYHMCEELAEVMREKRPVEIYLIGSENSEIAKSTAAAIIDEFEPPLN